VPEDIDEQRLVDSDHGLSPRRRLKSFRWPGDSGQW
jgi:hypothetical protein